MKHCTKCGAAKPAADFYPDRTRKDGLFPHCRACVLAARKARQAACRDEIAATRKAARSTPEQRQKISEYNARYFAQNRTIKRQAATRWAQSNRWYRRATKAAYLGRKVSATPPWFDAAKVNAIYRQAREMRDLGIDCHVDHIIPLRGATVCGLHWHGNLQILLADDNRLKSNRILGGTSPLYIDPDHVDVL